MRDNRGIAECAKKHGIAQLEKPSRLPRRKQPPPDFIGPQDRDAAHDYLLHRRNDVKGKVEPSKSKRAKLGLLRDSQIEKTNNSFTLQERQDAVDTLLQDEQPVGLVQAIIDFRDHPVLDTSIYHTAPAKVSTFRRAKTDGRIKRSPWLELATEKDLEDYLQLLVRRDPIQKSLDTVLATVLPHALKLSSKNKRCEVVQLLIHKGVRGVFVDQALLEVVTNPSICDVRLIKMLLEGRASVNYHQDGQNCILKAAQDGNLSILCLLAAPERSALPQLLSHAIQLLYQSRAKSVYADFVKTLTFLLQYGADCSSDLVAQTLVSAIRAAEDEECSTIIELMLQYGANINYDNGQAIREAIQLKHDKVLATVCTTNRITRNSFAHALQPAIEISRGDQSKLNILMYHCKVFSDISGEALLSEITQGPCDGQEEIVQILLDNGADINHKEGAVISKVITITSLPKSLRYVRLLLAKGPLELALRTAFTSARRLNCSLSHRHDLFRLILDAGFEGNEINPALADTITANRDDLTIPRLLLHHKADVNHEHGSILASAVDSGNIQLVAMLIAHQPISLTVNRSFKTACHAHIPATRRIEIFECLFATDLVSGDTTTYALTNAVTNGNKDHVLLGLLGRHTPTIEVETLLSLIRDHDVSTTQFLLKFQLPSKATRSHAFRACFDLERVLRLAFAELLIGKGLEKAVWTAAMQKAIEDQDLDLLDLLLLHSSNGHAEIGEALVLAADTGNTIILRALLSQGPNDSARDQAFENIMTLHRQRSPNEFKPAAIALLEYGISQPFKDRALVQSFEIYGHDESDFYQVLIEHGADVTTRSCICFILAGQFEDLSIFNLLLRTETDFDLVIKSLIGQFPQERYARLVELIFTTLNCPFYKSNCLDVSVIFDAMRRFSQGEGLIRLLLDHGYPAGQTMRSGEIDYRTTEPVTPIIWALGQSKGGISDDIILALLEASSPATPGFMSRESGATAISLAAQLGRHAILQRLIELKVDISAVDRSGKSPLFYATANADHMSVCRLLKKGTQPNDGSLHEAARLCQEGTVELLLENYHDPDYSSDLHEGRTALGELCSEATVRSGEEISAAYAMMNLLIKAPTDLSFRTRGKTILHLALDNDQPLEVTRALLRFPEIYKELRTDSETFIYEDDQGRFMSPDVYAQRYCNSDNHSKPQLVAVLESKCKTKWFTKTGPQLNDNKGLPRELEEMKKQQDLADQAEQRAIQRRQQSANMELQISQEHHRNNLLQSREQADLSLLNAQQLNDQQLAHDSRMSEQRRNQLYWEREAERVHMQERHRLTYEAAQQTSQLEYSSQQQMRQLESSSQNQRDQQRYAALQLEAGIEKDLIESREAAEKRSQTRAIERWSRQDESVRLVAQEQRGLIAAAKDARVDTEAVKLPALTWNEEVD